MLVTTNRQKPSTVLRSAKNKLPLLFLWFGAPRRKEWRDAGENNPKPMPKMAVPA